MQSVEGEYKLNERAQRTKQTKKLYFGVKTEGRGGGAWLLLIIFRTLQQLLIADIETKTCDVHK